MGLLHTVCPKVLENYGSPLKLVLEEVSAR